MTPRRALQRVLAVLAVLATAGPVAADERPLRVAAASGAALGEWSARVDRLLGSHELVPRLTRDDTQLPGRRHERLAQLHRGVPVFGGELTRQSDDTGATLSVFGTLYEGIDVGVTPRLGAGAAEAKLAERGGRPFGSRGGPELVVLPLDGGFRLAWRIRALFEAGFDVRQVFLDATSAQTLLEYRDLHTQAAGIGTGVLGEQKKISVSTASGGYTTADRLRPPLISTYDFKFNVNRLIVFLNSSDPVSNLNAADLGLDADNVWTDGALVDAHAYAGYTYDYYYARHGRRGLDNANIPVHSITHAIQREDWIFYTTGTVDSYFANAFYYGDGIMYYGDGLPPSVVWFGQHVSYLAGALGHRRARAHPRRHRLLVEPHLPGRVGRARTRRSRTSWARPSSSSSSRTQADYLMGEDAFTPGRAPLDAEPDGLRRPRPLLDPLHGLERQRRRPHQQRDREPRLLPRDRGRHAPARRDRAGRGRRQPRPDRARVLPGLHGLSRTERHLLAGARGDDPGGARALRRGWTRRGGRDPGLERHRRQLRSPCMTRFARRPAPGLLSAALLVALPALALGQTPPPQAKPAAPGTSKAKAKAKPAGPAETRVRIVLDAVLMPSSQAYSSVSTPIAYAEPSSIRASYEAGTGFGLGAAVQVSLYRGFGLLAGYSHSSRDASGTLEVSRPHPLYLNRPRTATAELSGYGYTESGLDLDLAFARSAGSIDWALFAGVTLFSVEADLLDTPTFDEQYPYDELTITSTTAHAVDESATGFNVGGRLDYRFGSSKRFGVGLSARYSTASVGLVAGADAAETSLDLGGFSVGAGVRIYF